MNKKGGDKLISVYWFLILVIIAGGVVAMANIFYSSPYDVRNLESEILSRKIADCLVHGGEINPELISGESFKPFFKDHFLEVCNFTFEKKTEFEKDAYFTEIKFYTQNNLEKAVFEISEGNLNWIGDCDFEKTDNEKLVRCSKNGFYAISENGKIFFIDILTIVRKTEQNVN